ncbi:MAG: cysteine--1-D-myo-inosityl 2-amino-2-deoxy-alpha-D-glucopyranoside ligase [Propionibacteriaceae bacterium]
MHAWSSPVVPTVASNSDTEGSAELWLCDSAGNKKKAGPDSGTARLYVCGITPYDATHMGHAFTYVTFDLLQRVWRDCGLAVRYVQNVTDVDDPLLERANATGQKWDQLALSQIDLFREDMEALRVLAPDHYGGVVESLPEVIDLIEQLQASDWVYKVADSQYPDLYFRTTRAPGFAEVSELGYEEMLSIFAERGGDPDRVGKDHPLDCLVWRMAREAEPSWESPFGQGRPGWHVECTAIALAHLGEAFDVQGGGSDLVFPHHEMCAAEASALTGVPFAKTYVHASMVGLDGEKMSKSRGNLVFVSKLRAAGVDPMVIRLVLLAHHYRSDWFWSDAELTVAADRLSLWRQAVLRTAGPDASILIDELRAAMRDDLDAPRALAVMDKWASSDGTDTSAPSMAKDIVDALLGIAL